MTILTSNCTANTIDEVKQRGFLQCGVSQSLLGFSYRENGAWTGLDVDICRAIATAIFGNAELVKFTPLSTIDRFSSLQKKSIDLLSRNTTMTYNRDTTLGITFTNITYYDGQGFMVSKKSGINKIADLANKTICTRGGTTSEFNLKDYFATNKIPYKPLVFQYSDREVLSAYHAGDCDAYSGDRSALAAQREKLIDPTEHIILGEVISKEPLGPAVRADDLHWINLVRWVVHGLIAAEEYGITQANLKTYSDNADNVDPKIKFFLGLSGDIGQPLGLNKKFMYNIISAVGNYKEIFERNVGSKSKLNLPRGLNKLWLDQGLMYSPPFI